MLHTLSVGGVGVALAGQFPAYAMQAARTAETPPLAPLNRFPRMVQEFFVERENEVHQQRLKRLAELTTKADAEAYVQTVRGKIRESLRTLSRKDAAQCPRDEGRRARRLQDRERALRKPSGVPGVGESLHSEGTEFPASGRGGLVRAFGQRQGDRDVSIVLPGAGAPGLRGADLRSDRPGRTACSTWTRTGSPCAGQGPASTTTPASSRSSSTSASACGARGTAFAPSTT